VNGPFELHYETAIDKEIFYHKFNLITLLSKLKVVTAECEGYELGNEGWIVVEYKDG
jgi:hypothetical protein